MWSGEGEGRWRGGKDQVTIVGRDGWLQVGKWCRKREVGNSGGGGGKAVGPYLVTMAGVGRLGC